jgi:hypothetical protein
VKSNLGSGRGTTGIENNIIRIKMPSFVERLKTYRTTKPSDPWIEALRKINGEIGHDRVERISTEKVFERLDVPRLQRTPEAAKRLRGLMVELGWTAVRSRHVTSRGRASRVRGYARMPTSPRSRDAR